MSKFSKIAWGKFYNQVFLYCMHIYQQFLLLEGQINRFLPITFVMLVTTCFPSKFCVFRYFVLLLMLSS